MSHQNVFKDRKSLDEMLNLRKQGWSLNALAYKYKVSSHHAIQYHCIKNGLSPGHVGKSNAILIYHYNPFNFTYILHVVVGACLPERYRINPGKTYREYLKADKARTQEVTVKPVHTRKTKPIISITLNHGN